MSLVVVYSIWFAYSISLAYRSGEGDGPLFFYLLRGGYTRGRGETALALKKSIK
jgi:hypothetical protein